MCSIGLMTSDACEGQQDIIETLSNEEKIQRKSQVCSCKI